MFCERVKTTVLVLCLLIFSGCAVKPPGSSIQVNELAVLKSDFGTGIGAAVDYFTNDNATLITLNVENVKLYDLDIWIFQSYSSDGLETIYRKRIYKTSDILTTRKIRVSKLEENVTETIKFEMFDDRTGGLLFETDPIHSDGKGLLYASEADLLKAFPFLLDRR